MRGVFVTGTDTGIGKTVFSAGLAWALRKRKIDVGVMKPFATGASAFSKKYRSEDVAMLAKAAGVKEIDSELNPSYYDVPASPLMASVLTGESPPVMQNIIKSLRGLSLRHDFLIVEGIGGIQVPLAKGVSVADFVELTGLPVIIVSRAAVGTLNHTILTVNECKAHGLHILGIIINMMPKRPTEVEKFTPEFLTRLTGVPVLGMIPQVSRPSPASIGKQIQKVVDLSPLLPVK